MAITRHQYRIYIKAPIEQVWNAIIDPAFTKRYFHGTSFDTPPAAGQPYRTSLGNGAPAVDGTIEVLDPPHRLVMTWHVLYDAAMSDEPASRVEWNLSAAAEGLTQLDLVHGDLFKSPLTWSSVRMGWLWILDAMKTLVETGDEMPALSPTSMNGAMNGATNGDATEDSAEDPTGEWHRAQGIECNNAIWDLVDADPSTARDEELLRRAYASAYHWQRAARRTPNNEVRAQYMLAKVHLLISQPERSLLYANGCKDLCEQQGITDFDLAYAREARARALKALGREGEAQVEWAAAKATPVANAEDLAIVEADLVDF